MYLDLQQILDWACRCATLSSLVLLALRYCDGAVEIWYPRQAGSRFWAIYDKTAKTFEYLSISPQRRLKLLNPSTDSADPKGK